MRFLLEATPGWRTLNIVLALSTVGLTLMLVYWSLGSAKLRNIAFPICFILVAVPWPYSIEVPLIQGLTQANASTVIEVLGTLGIPAAQHGNLIEVATGTVGIDEACSGIRSFQSSLMISLFLGEFYRLALRTRVLMVPVGFLVAFLFNICRTTILTWLAANKGVPAIAEYHDQAGLTILLACTAGMWGIAWILHRKQQKSAPQVPTSDLRPPTSDVRALPGPRVYRLSLALLAWLAAVEFGVEFWYRAHETHSPRKAEWTLSWPPQEMGFRELPIAKVTSDMLGYDEGHSGSWTSNDGTSWQMFYCRWLPNRRAIAGARGHNPSICLVAAGKELRKLDNNRAPMKLGSVIFPFRRYEFTESGRVVQVFHCLWEEHAAGTYFDFDPNISQLETRLRAAASGRRNLGQRSVEFVIAGMEDPKAAEAAVTAQLQKLIKVEVKP